MRAKNRRTLGPANKIKRFAIGLCLMVIIGLLLLMHNLINQPAVGSVQAAAQTMAQPTQTQDSSILSVNGKYLSFDYPGFFKPVPVDNPSGQQLSTFDYITKTSPFWELAVQISSLPSGNLNDDGSYHMRSISTDHYLHTNWVIQGKQVDVFADQTDGYSKAAFIVHQGKLVSVALSGSGNETRMDSVLRNVLNSLEWK